MKLFLDSANMEEIQAALDLGFLDGVTTNPTLVSRQGEDIQDIVGKICRIVKGPVTAEVISVNVSGILKEAREFAQIGDNVVVQIPIIREGLAALRQLASEGIATIASLCFDPLQALLAAKVGARYVAPLVARLEEIGYNGMDVVADIRHIYDNYQMKTEIIVSSVRNPIHVLEATRIGADAVTMPFEIFSKLPLHPMTDIGVRKYLADWEKSLH